MAQVDTVWLGIDLLGKSGTGHIIIVILCAILTFAQTKMTQMVQPATPTKLPVAGEQAMPDMSGMMKYMSYFIAFMM